MYSRPDKDGSAPRGVKARRWMAPGPLERLLQGATPADDASTFTLYLPPGQGETLQSREAPPGVGEWLSDAVAQAPEIGSWKGGAALFAAGGQGLVVLPPFPLASYGLTPGWDWTSLIEHLRRERTIGVVLLRLGRYAVGVFRGPRLVDSKTDTRYVKGRHRAGGSSQRRFERIRERQVREIFDKACAVAREKLAPFEGELEYLSLGGEGHTLSGFLERCPYLEGLDAPILPRTLDVRVPNRAALERVCRTIYESLVITLE